MKYLLIIFLLSGLNASSQLWELAQPDSVYKINKVKSRTTRFNSSNNFDSYIINNYDAEGRLIERLQFDHLGTKYYNRSTLGYDISGKLVSKTYFTYWHNDKAGIVVDSVPNISSFANWTFNYDPRNKLTKTIITNSSGKVTCESVDTFDPFTTTFKFYNATNSNHTSGTIIYETPFISKREFGFFDSANVIKSTWDYHFKNTYDKCGRVVKRVKTSPDHPGWAMEEFFEYDSNGLLIKITSHNSRSSSNEHDVIILFEYQYLPLDGLTNSGSNLNPIRPGLNRQKPQF